MKNTYKIIKRNIFLYQIPNKDITNGLEVIWKPSKYWIKKHPDLEPIIKADIEKDKREYMLPPYFRTKSILRINSR